MKNKIKPQLKSLSELREGDIMILTHIYYKSDCLVFKVERIKNKLMFSDITFGMPMIIKKDKKYPIVGNIKKSPNFLEVAG
jgi:hypothetical protein